MAEKKASKAASPPAEAPMPTMGKLFSGCAAGATTGPAAAAAAFIIGFSGGVIGRPSLGDRRLAIFSGFCFLVIFLVIVILLLDYI
jgi:hypothetical protein